MVNKIQIASAGSGKTTALVKTALEISDERVLITTFTEANELEITNKFIQENGCVPKNITIQTWFSFLIQHGVKPFQDYLYKKTVKGLILVNRQSGLKYSGGRFPVYHKETEEAHYFTNTGKIYSDKLAKFVVKVNAIPGGLVMDRLSRIYSHIFIDESQDLAGYDLEIVKLFAVSSLNLLLVCDPRQVTYVTHHEAKFKKYRNGLLQKFIEDECKGIDFEIDDTSLSKTYRCNALICDFANELHPTLPNCTSANTTETNHDGVLIIREDQCNEYLEKHKPTQLRWNSVQSINPAYDVYNFGQSKGLSFDRVLIYPTTNMIKWIQDHSSDLGEEARAKLYVAITRARNSVAIVIDDCDVSKIPCVSAY